MSSSLRIDDTATPGSPARALPDRRRADSSIAFLVDPRSDADVVKIDGELDIAGIARVTRLCTDARTRHVVVDLSDLTFLDCGGCRALIAARNALARQHRTLEIVGAVGQPRRLLDLVQQFAD